MVVEASVGDSSSLVVVVSSISVVSTHEGGNMGGAEHPISWAHEYDGGRSFYTAVGHTVGSYSEPVIRAHLLDGIIWAAQVE